MITQPAHPRNIKPWLSLILVLTFARLAFSQNAPPWTHSERVSTPHLTLELIAEEDAISPGRDFWVGLFFKLENGWHVYWINPGDSGEPPKIQWKLPPGFHAGAILWPYPQRLPLGSGSHLSLMDYGYEGQVLLPIRMRAAQALKPGETAKLVAAVKWLVCRQVCIPEKGEFSITVPVTETAGDRGGLATRTRNPTTLGKDASANHELFARTRARIPHPPPRRWRVVGYSSANEFALSLQTGYPVKNAQFFPLEPLQIENAAPQKIETNPRGARLVLKKSEQISKPPARLKGVLVLADTRAYVIDAPVVSSRAK